MPEKVPKFTLICEITYMESKKDSTIRQACTNLVNDNLLQNLPNYTLYLLMPTK